MLDQCHFDGTPTYPQNSGYIDANWYVEIQRPKDPISLAVQASGVNVSEATRVAARKLLRLLSMRPDPEIVIEDSGEISLEWSNEQAHVAVLSVDGQYLRWAGAIGNGRTTSGLEEFDGSSVPHEAMDLLNQAT